MTHHVRLGFTREQEGASIIPSTRHQDIGANWQVVSYPAQPDVEVSTDLTKPDRIRVIGTITGSLRLERVVELEKIVDENLGLLHIRISDNKLSDVEQNACVISKVELRVRGPHTGRIEIARNVMWDPRTDYTLIKFDPSIAENLRETLKLHRRNRCIISFQFDNREIDAEIGPISLFRREAKATAAATAPVPDEDSTRADIRYYYEDPSAPERLPVDTLVSALRPYDVVSFDIFDTALVRCVHRPNDVFRIMGGLLGITGFAAKRKDAENHARTWNDRLKGTREVSLQDIYTVLTERHGGTPDWQELEKALEIKLARPNPYIYQVYEKLRALGKTLVFTSDMYLPSETLKAMLSKAGYEGYTKIYVSNEHGARKGDGTLQRVIREDLGSDRSIVHVGDDYKADVEKSIEAGIHAIHTPDNRSLVRENDMGSLAGSFYQAVIDAAMGAKLWDKSLHYTHGFRVGGVLALGYVEFIRRVANAHGVDRILFLGRDCDVLSKIYTKFFNEIPSRFVGISRAAAFMLTSNKNFNDYIGRTFFRWYHDSNNSRPLCQLLVDTGFGYLCDYLEDADIEPLQFPASASEQQIRQFFWDNRSVIQQHNAASIANAEEYFSEAIGSARNILVVDIGWTGSCIAGLRDFLTDRMGENAPRVFGALLATSRNEQITDSVSEGWISSYIYSPTANLDLARFIMPAGKIQQRKRDLLTLPVEYLFTSTTGSTVGYGRDADGKPVPLYGENTPTNIDQIIDIQRGMIDFVERYLDFSAEFEHLRHISSYVAFQPLRNAISHRSYLYQVYKDFLYDAAPVLHGGTSVFERFGDLFDPRDQVNFSPAFEDTRAQQSSASIRKPGILFIQPEMNYDGSPHSLLRICKVADNLGYAPIVWTARNGPFVREFASAGFPVQVVPDTAVDLSKIEDLTRENIKLVVCNTVATEGYVRAIEGKLPLVWYIREATNLPQFLRGNPVRAETLRASSSVTVVSEYAAQSVSQFTDGPVQVVKNAVEDLSAYAGTHYPCNDGIIRFVQLGTIEHRKGYDLLVSAYKAMPKQYRERAEIHFAGRFINSATSFASYLFGQIIDEPNIHYHGIITDEMEKIKLLSSMDVVVVASRDESCSLVALEGAMLSKPLIVTENVGAKYLVDEGNGMVVPSGSVQDLRDAFMQMIDRSADDLVAMGAQSRTKYERLASMRNHTGELAQLFLSRILDGPAKMRPIAKPGRVNANVELNKKLIVSLTSFPGRMNVISKNIESIKNQTKAPDLIILWLSKDQFPQLEEDLPLSLLEMLDLKFQIRWVEGDIGPHKKYFYAMQEYPDALVITLDDDVYYDKEVVETLCQGHLERPSCVIALRSNLIRFRPGGSLRAYDLWGYNHSGLRETETYSLLPTGIGGILYPPGSVPPQAFDAEAIMATCPRADDLWLKVMTTANGYPVWMPWRSFEFPLIEGSQQSALWRINAFHNGNDAAIQSILSFFDERYGSSEELLQRIRGVRPDGSYVGPGDVLDRTSLLTTVSTSGHGVEMRHRKKLQLTPA